MLSSLNGTSVPSLKELRESNCRCEFENSIWGKEPFLEQTIKKATLSSGLKGLSTSIFVCITSLLPFVILVEEGVVENARDCTL